MKQLHIGQGFSVPLDAVTQKMAYLGRTGSGKTYAATKMAEEMIDANAQVVVLDPVGVWFGLRLLADGKSPGIPIHVFGGLNGDIPLEPTGGVIAADFIVDTGASVILDVSQFESDTQKARFATDFADRFFFRKKAAPSAVHIFMEECQEFIAQNPMKGEERMLHAFTRLWKLGRNFGIGGSLISQRPQEVNKKALNMSECLFAFQMTGPHERKTIESWVSEKGLDLDIVGILPKLKVGECQAWSPQWLNINQTVAWKEKRTFNASSTPLVGGASAKKAALAPVDLSKLSKEMLATVERAKQNDPELLKKRIRELERAKPQPKQVDESAIARALERGKQEAHRELSARIKSLESVIARQQQTMKQAAERLIGVAVDLPKYEAPKIQTAPTRRYDAVVQKPDVGRRQQGVRTNIVQSDVEVKLGFGARRMLRVLMQYHPNGVTEGLMRSHAKLKKSGTFTTYKSQLRMAGLIDENNGLFYATDSAIEQYGHEAEQAPQSTEEVIMMWGNRLGAGARRMLQVLVEAGGEFVEEQDLLSASGLAKSGTFTTYKSQLRTANLIITQGNMIAANKDTLFL